MSDVTSECVICRGKAGDVELRRIQVWEDALWRLTISLEAEVLGFAYLEPKRHIPHLTDLSGEEARTFGDVLGRVSRALQVVTGVFGESVPHLHLHLAPHTSGDGLNTQIIRGEFTVQELESGAQRYVSKDFPVLPESEQRLAAERVRQILSSKGGV
jgi:diadenosine tetraphosphate (Ap4A) HIT family hydrolase